RFDRGFDPRSRFAAAHLDAYLARWTPLDTPLLNLQFGKFATMIGTWAQRHDSWSNPFVTAPLPYENVTAISDGAAPATPQAFRRRLDARRLGRLGAVPAREGGADARSGSGPRRLPRDRHRRGRELRAAPPPALGRVLRGPLRRPHPGPLALAVERGGGRHGGLLPRGALQAHPLPLRRAALEPAALRRGPRRPRRRAGVG